MPFTLNPFTGQFDKVNSRTVSLSTSFGVTTVTPTVGGSVVKVVWDALQDSFSDAGGAFVLGSGSTQSRFTPTIPGFYLMDLALGSGDGVVQIYLQKNGTIINILAGSGAWGGSSIIVHADAGDYFEVFFVGGTISTDVRRNWWQGFLLLKD